MKNGSTVPLDLVLKYKECRSQARIKDFSITTYFLLFVIFSLSYKQGFSFPTNADYFLDNGSPIVRPFGSTFQWMQEQLDFYFWLANSQVTARLKLLSLENSSLSGPRELELVPASILFEIQKAQHYHGWWDDLCPGSSLSLSRHDKCSDGGIDRGE